MPGHRFHSPCRLCVFWAVLGSLWLAGCASTPKNEDTPAQDAPLPPLPAATARQRKGLRALQPVPPTPAEPPSPVAAPSLLRPTPPEPERPPSAATRKPASWNVLLEHGSRRAVVDGVTLWLSEPARQECDQQVLAGPADQRASLDPLLQATPAPFVRERPMRILLDPGHGGKDPGALTRDRKQRESTYVLDVARRLSTYLNRAGYDVRMTRMDDATCVPLEDRTAMAAAWPADVLVSLHLNSALDGAAEGVETFALPPAGMLATYQVDQPKLSPKALARVRQACAGNRHDADNLRLAFCIQRRLLKTTGRQDRGIRRARFMVLRDAAMPAVLVEAGFLSNRREAEFVGTPNGRERIARGIYQGLCDFAAGHIAPGHPPAPVVSGASLPPGN